MAIKNKYFNPQNFYYKVLATCVLIAIDIILNSFTQFFDFGSNNVLIKYKMTGYEKISNGISYVSIAIQFLIQLLIIFSLLSIFSQTFFFKYGFLKMTCSKFKYSFIFLFIYPIMFLIERIVRSTYIDNPNNIDNNELTVWQKPLYVITYVLKYVFAFLFYLVTINTSYELGKSKYYKSDPTFGFKMNL